MVNPNLKIQYKDCFQSLHTNNWCANYTIYFGSIIIWSQSMERRLSIVTWYHHPLYTIVFMSHRIKVMMTSAWIEWKDAWTQIKHQREACCEWGPHNHVNGHLPPFVGGPPWLKYKQSSKIQCFLLYGHKPPSCVPRWLWDIWELAHNILPTVLNFDYDKSS